MIDQNGPRIVADKISGANEIRFAEDETRLTVAETGGDHIQHFRFQPDGSLTDREIYSPERLGGGPDGFCFDAYGNIWTIAADRLVAITPEGDVLTIWEDGDGDGAAKAAAMAFGKAGGDCRSDRRREMASLQGWRASRSAGRICARSIWGRWSGRRCRCSGRRCWGRSCRGGSAEERRHTIKDSIIFTIHPI